MPIGKVQTANTEAQCAGPPRSRVFHWGKAPDVIIIDTRSCRSDNAQNICKGDILPTLPPGCINAVNDPTRRMLGNTQKAMFKDALAHSTAKYKFVIRLCINATGIYFSL